jgi:hypothetical protein
MDEEDVVVASAPEIQTQLMRTLWSAGGDMQGRMLLAVQQHFPANVAQAQACLIDCMQQNFDDLTTYRRLRAEHVLVRVIGDIRFAGDCLRF